MYSRHAQYSGTVCTAKGTAVNLDRGRVSVAGPQQLLIRRTRGGSEPKNNCCPTRALLPWSHLISLSLEQRDINLERVSNTLCSDRASHYCCGTSAGCKSSMGGHNRAMAARPSMSTRRKLRAGRELHQCRSTLFHLQSFIAGRRMTTAGDVSGPLVRTFVVADS